MEGSVDAIAESLIEEPRKDDETTEEELVQAEADADDQSEAEEDEAEEAEAEEDDSEEDDADADDEGSTEQLFTVKVNGREQQVPLAELLRGYSGQKAIQEGFQQAAALRKEVETGYMEVQRQYQQLTQIMSAVGAGQLPLQPPQPPSADMIQSDPMGYLEARAQYETDIARYQQTQAGLEQVRQQQAALEGRAHIANLQSQQQELVRAIPAFADKATAAKLKQELISMGSEVYGYAPEELRAVADHRAIRVLHDAAQYRRLMAGKPPVERQAAQPKIPTVKPGVKVSAQSGKRVAGEKAKAQMKRTGSVDDVARFLLM
jgi:hypothetical protein